MVEVFQWQDGTLSLSNLYYIDFSPTDGLAPQGAVDVGGFPMVWMAAELGMAAELMLGGKVQSYLLSKTNPQDENYPVILA